MAASAIAGEDCTFEMLEKCFQIRDRRIGVIGQMIHDADLCDEKFGRKEGFGVDAVLNGWARQGMADRELLDLGMQLVEALYGGCLGEVMSPPPCLLMPSLVLVLSIASAAQALDTSKIDQILGPIRPEDGGCL